MGVKEEEMMGKMRELSEKEAEMLAMRAKMKEMEELMLQRQKEGP